MVKMTSSTLLLCICVVVRLTLGQDVGGFFLLAGVAENTLYKLENGSFSAIPVSNQIETISFDPTSRRVYYGSSYSIHLYSMMLDGTDVRVEATTDLYVQVIAIDSVAGNIFVYSPGNTGRIYRIVMGQDPTLDQSDVIHEGEHEVFSMTVDPRTRTLFWGSTTGVWQSNYDGTNKKHLLSTSIYISGLTVDERNVYFILNEKIFKLIRSSSPIYYTEIFNTSDSSRDKSLVLVGDSLYFSRAQCAYNPTNKCNSSIAAIHTDGTGFRHVGPVLSSDRGYQQTLVYVNSTNNVTIPATTTTTRPPTVPVKSPAINGYFLLAGLAANTLYKLENGSFSAIPVSNQIETIAFDPTSRRVYYGSSYSIHLYSMMLDGTDVRVEATTDLYVQVISIDSVAGNIFVYSPGNTGKIYRIVMGQDPTLDQSDIIHEGEGEVFYMTVDPRTRTLFWGSTTGVWQSNYDGTNKKHLLSTSIYISGLTVDERNVYFILNEKIIKLIRSSSPIYYTEIFNTSDSSRDKSLVLVGESLYFSRAQCVYNPTNRCNSSIAAIHTDGTGFRHVGPVLSSDRGYQQTLVYVNSTNNVTIPATTTTTRPPTVPVQSPVIDGFFLLIGTGVNTVYKLENGSFSALAVSNQIETIAFDPTSRRVYYGSSYSIHLYSMMLDGTDVRVEATTDLYVQVIAIDSVVGNIFVYSPGNTGKIYRIVMGQDPTLDQSDIIHEGEREVFYMTVDPETRTLFWGSTTGVWQSNYDGTNKKHLLSTSIDINGLTVDGSYVYGIKNKTIFKIDRSLSSIYTEIFITGGSSRAGGLVLVENRLYFSTSQCVYSPTRRCNSSIDTLKTDGTDFKRFGSTLLTDLGYNHVLVYVPRSNSKTPPPAFPTTPTAPPCGESDIDDIEDDSFFLSGAAERSIYKLNENRVYSTIPMSHTVTAQAYDHNSNRIYYGVAFQLYVYSMRIDGSDVRIEATTDMYVQALAVDSKQKRLFVYTTSKGNIYMVRLGQDWTMDQSNPIHSNQAEVFHMVADPQRSKLIWGSYYGVFQSNYDGTDKEQLFSHIGYIDGVTFDESSIYVLTEASIYTIDRFTLISYAIYRQKFTQNGFLLSGLVETEGHIYFGKYHCTYNPSTDCIIEIARVRNDGTMYEDVGPILRTTFIQTPKLVHKSNGKQLERCRTEDVETIYPVGELNHKGEINGSVVAAFILCPLIMMAVVVLVFTWWKVRGRKEGCSTCLEAPHRQGNDVGTNNQLTKSVVYMVPSANSEKEALEKQYREKEALEQQNGGIHVYDQIQ